MQSGFHFFSLRLKFDQNSYFAGFLFPFSLLSLPLLPFDFFSPIRWRIHCGAPEKAKAWCVRVMQNKKLNIQVGLLAPFRRKANLFGWKTVLFAFASPPMLHKCSTDAPRVWWWWKILCFLPPQLSFGAFSIILGIGWIRVRIYTNV